MRPTQMMKHVAGFLFVALVLLATSAFSITLRGKVVDTVTGGPIHEVQVEIIQDDIQQRDTVVTNIAGNWSFSLPTSLVTENPGMPSDFRVSQNYPNPFNPSTTIHFAVAKPGRVRIAVHNVLGQQIDSREALLAAGSHQIHWESRGGAGVYFYTITTETSSITRKMLQLESVSGAGLSDVQSGDFSFDSGLRKPALLPITLIFRKTGYTADTLSTSIVEDAYFESSLESFHSSATMVDLHNDVLYKIAEGGENHLSDPYTPYHTDIRKLRLGGVDVQFLAIWISPTNYPEHPFQRAMDYVETMNLEFALAADDFEQARTATEVMDIIASGKIAGVMALEGGHSIESNLDNLYQLYHAGMRYMTITWNNSTDWATAAKDPLSETVGLSDFGEKVIRSMDSLGVMIDISHTGIKTVEDILAITRNPIIASHSGARALRDHYRNLYDEQIIAIANTGGLVGVVFYPYFLSSTSSSVNVQTVVDHIDYIAQLVGIEYVGIGSDFDGIERTPIGLENSSKFPNVTTALLQRGYSYEDVEKILGGNVLRVFQQVCGGAL